MVIPEECGQTIAHERGHQLEVALLTESALDKYWVTGCRKKLEVCDWPLDEKISHLGTMVAGATDLERYVVDGVRAVPFGIATIRTGKGIIPLHGERSAIVCGVYDAALRSSS